jgi:alpha-tubulin suppressor-like RCC1 family protein
MSKRIGLFLFVLLSSLMICGNAWAVTPQIAGGSNHTISIKSDGTLWAWGNNLSGQLGDGTNTDRNAPVQIGTDTDWISIAAGEDHTIALKSDGTLWAWGWNGFGQLGNGTNTASNIPVQEDGTDTDWVQVAAGGNHTLALKSDGTLWTWGWNDDGQLGNGSNTDSDVPVQIGADTDWVRVAGGERFTLALKSDGTLWAWGSNSHGQLGNGTNGIGTDKNAPVQIGADTDWVSVAGGADDSDHTVALKSDGTLWAWGWNGKGQLGDGTNTDSNVPVQITTVDNNWVTIAAGQDHTIALKSDGTLWAWGFNFLGQLGDGTNTDRNCPVQIGTDTDWVAIAAGDNHTIALKSDGTLWAWGFNFYGQLGDSTNGDSDVPILIGSATDWVAIAAGGWHTIALKSDGTLWAWGRNTFGQLGDNTTTQRNSPVQEVRTDTDWVQVAAGSTHTIALKSDGTLWAWGLNFSGQLGDNTTTSKKIPVQEDGNDTDWVAIAAGDNHTIALKSNGTLWAWGFNSNGQLGDGTNGFGKDKKAPVQIGSDTDWVAIAGGGWHTIALKSDGTLWAWGLNGEGQLGDGTNTDKNAPVKIGTDTDWVAIAAGQNHTVALKSNGTLWAWGENTEGQLGDGTNTDKKNTPMQIGHCCLCPLDSNLGCISGTVRDSGTGALVAGKRVWLFKRKYKRKFYKRTKTNEDGCYIFDRLRNRSYTVYVGPSCRNVASGKRRHHVRITGGGKLDNVNFECN